MVIELSTWCYLKSTNLLYDHPFIPKDAVRLKICGDHGGSSFKASFQIANVLNPNQPNNTVIFSIMEAKDYRTNLLLCLERFKAHIEQFRKVKWEGKCFLIFLLGDYVLCMCYVCTMYVLCAIYVLYICMCYVCAMYVCMLCMGYVWAMYGLCMGYVWAMYGLCMGYVWAMYGLCMGYVWAMYGLCMGYVWAMYGLCMCYVCAMYVLCMCYVCAMYGLCMCYVCAMYVLCMGYLEPVDVIPVYGVKYQVI